MPDLRPTRHYLIRALCAVSMSTVLVGCVDTSESANQRRVPCAGDSVVSLGNPNPLDRPASFEVVRGPVWVGVEGWDPGMLDPSPYRAVIEVGPSDRPPERDKNGNIPSRTGRVVVVDGKWSRLDIEKGRYWLLASSIADTVHLQVCGPARIGAVKPAT
jgi:hypothetical protein